MDVQEIKEEVPERFVRDDMIIDPTQSISSSAIPVIDFSKLSSSQNSGDELHALAAACRDWGYFQVINHGIDSKLMEKMMEVSEEFFMMPLEEKEKYRMEMGGAEGYGKAFVFSDDQKLDWCNTFALSLLPLHSRTPHLWPTKPHTFRETLEEYTVEMRKLCGDVMKKIAASLGLRESVFGEIFGATVQTVRMNYFPPCSRPNLVLGFSSHSDGSALTVLHEKKNGPAGLQILKDDDWVSVRSFPGSLIINVGDTIEVVTNGKYKSVEHRAVAHRERERLSIATFFLPDYNVELGPLDEFVDDINPRKYKRYNHGDYSKHYFANKLEGKKRLDYAKIDPNNSSK